MKKLPQVFIFLLFVLEVLLVTFWKGIWGPHTSALFLFITSLLIGVLSMRNSFQGDAAAISLPKAQPNLRLLISIVTCTLGIIVIASLLSEIFASYTLDKEDVSRSDVIPLIIVMVERFLDGAFPYSPHTFPGYTLRPTYMPLVWAPFTIAEVFDFDYRWVPASFLTITLILLQFLVIRRCKNLWIFILLSLLPWIVWYAFITEDKNLFSITIENINVAYYLIFGLCLWSRRPFLIGLGLAACLLSRYSFALWVPFLGLIYLIHDRSALWKIVGVSLVSVIVLYIIPFLIKDPVMFKDSLASYTVAAVGEWAPSWQPEGAKPYHLFRGLGLAGLFYEYIPGEIIDRIKTLQTWHYITSILISFPMLLLFWKNRKKVNLPYFLIASLKIYFVFFYSFIQVPYSYLFMVPVFISLLIVILSITEQDKIAAIR